MRSWTIGLLSITLAAAACGGKNKGRAAGGAGAEGDDPATPFNDATVKAALSSTPGVADCGADASTTMGKHFAAQRSALTGGDSAVVVSETFTCRAQPDTSWECEWAIFAQGSGYQISFTVANDGALMRDTITCVAPG